MHRGNSRDESLQRPTYKTYKRQVDASTRGVQEFGFRGN